MVVTVYGYRYYDPLTGRWPSRDLLCDIASSAWKVTIESKYNSLIDCYNSLFLLRNGKVSGNLILILERELQNTMNEINQVYAYGSGSALYSFVQNSAVDNFDVNGLSGWCLEELAKAVAANAAMVGVCAAVLAPEPVTTVPAVCACVAATGFAAAADLALHKCRSAP